MMAVRISRRRLTNWAQNPRSQRSAVRRLGARRRERCRTRSCCFKRIFSASTARVPPVPRRTASLASRCTITKIAFFMDKQLAQHRTQEQGSRIAAAAHLNYEFAMYRVGQRHLVPKVGKQEIGAANHHGQKKAEATPFSMRSEEHTSEL